jgi:hypothetical protein
MDGEAERLLWSVARKKASNRWPALYLLAIHAHRQSKSISGSLLTAYLCAQGFPPSDADRFGTEFDHYLGLLTMYDRLRA